MKFDLLFVLVLIGLSTQANLKAQSTLKVDGKVYITFTTLNLERTSEDNVVEAQHWFDKSDEQFSQDIVNSTPREDNCHKENPNLANFSNQITCKGNNSNVLYIIIVRFCADAGDVITVDSYHDFGIGGIYALNGETQTRLKKDTWWGFSLANKTLTFTKTFTEKGVQELNIMGGDVCCDGPQRVRITVNGNTQDATPDILNSRCEALGIDISDLPSPTPTPVGEIEEDDDC